MPKIENRRGRTRRTTRTRPVKSTKPGASELLRLRALIENCPDIPPQVGAAKVAYADDRVLDDSLFQKITEISEPSAADELRAATVQRRIDALTPFVGRRLVCLVITLPGVSYTIEIDPSDERIIYWEWQAD